MAGALLRADGPDWEDMLLLRPLGARLSNKTRQESIRIVRWASWIILA